MYRKPVFLAMLSNKLAFVVTTLVFLVGFSFIINSGAAYASSIPHSVSATKIAVGLIVDCPKLSPTVLKKAQTAGLCSKGGTTSHNTVNPHNTVSGSCGTSWLSLIDNYNNGYPSINIGASSSLGYMVYISWQVTWYNFASNHGGGYSGSQGYFGDTWSNTTTAHTGTSYDVYAVLKNLTVTTAYGYVCSGLQPYDYNQVN